MKRILLVLTVVLVTAAMMVVMAAPAFARADDKNNPTHPGYSVGQDEQKSYKAAENTEDNCLKHSLAGTPLPAQCTYDPGP